MDNKIICLLCCCLYPKNNQSTNNNQRIEEYVEGLSKFFEFVKDRYTSIDFYIIDNSITSGKQIPDSIVKILPNNIKIIEHSNNIYGAINKGGGLIENWLYAKEVLNKYDWLIHFEPRQHLKSFDFIDNFLNNPRSLFTLGKERNHFNTGLFCIKIIDLEIFLSLVNLNRMIQHNISIEYIIYDFFVSNNIEYHTLDKMDLIWFDNNLKRNM
jgi:hypothetical protein